MEHFRLTDDLRTGNGLIDGDHRELVDRLNALLDTMDDVSAKAGMPAAMARLVEYASEHFAREEAEMERARYVAVLAHKSEHVRLLKQIVELQGMLDAGGAINVPAVASFLSEWLRHHILTADRKLAFTLNCGKQAGGAPAVAP